MQAAKHYVDIFTRRSATAAALANLNDRIRTAEGVAVNKNFAGMDLEAVRTERQDASQAARRNFFFSKLGALNVGLSGGALALGTVSGVLPAAAVVIGTAVALSGFVTGRMAKKAEHAADQELLDRAERPDSSSRIRDQRAEFSEELAELDDELELAEDNLQLCLGARR